MKYSELELKKMDKMKNLTTEDQVKYNILNFIRTIYLNNQDFIDTSYDTKFFGDLPMTFKKRSGQVMGMITVKVDGKVEKYVFNDKGYERLDELLGLE